MARKNRGMAIWLLLVLVFSGTPISADHTAEGEHSDFKMCVRGDSDGVGWMWQINGTGGALSAATVPLGTVPAGANTAGALVQAFINSINDARVGSNFPNAQQVESSGCGPDSSAAFSVTVLEADRPISFFVGPEVGPVDTATNCMAVLCAFNPMFFQAPDDAEIPTLSEWGVVFLAMLLLGAGAWHLSRREKRPGSIA